MEMFWGRVGIMQRVLPVYRAGFFSALAQWSEGGLSIFAGQPRAGESVGVVDQVEAAELVQSKNWELFHPRAAIYFLWQGGMFAWLKRFDPDVLIVEANARYLSTRAAAIWMHDRGRPVIGWGLGLPRFASDRSTRGWFEMIQDQWWQSFLRSLDAVIAYSQQGARQYQRIGFPPERIFVAPNAVAPRPEGPPIERSLTYKDNPKVLFIGRLQARKRIDQLLLACARLSPEIQPDVWIVGDGPYREKFQSLAAEIYPRTEFYGSVRGDDLKPYLQNADLFVLPGTGGLAVQEAMAAGLPVIVAEGDGTQDDMVKPPSDLGPGNGWLVQPGDISSLAAALQDALSDVARLRRMGAESYRLVVQDYNLQEMVAVFVQALSNVDMWRNR